jgi:carbamoyl-phosphate synthase/aspartate carbamoyltransferase/dihydroorotase
VHSLAKLLTLYRVGLNFVSPPELGLPPEIRLALAENGTRSHYSSDLSEVAGKSDVIYMTRVQRERFEDPAAYERVQGSYLLTPETMKLAKKRMIVMHPFPRVGEIAMEVDSDPRAAYFRQMEYGLYVRMAILAMVLGKA